MTQLVSDQTADASRFSGRYQNWHQWRQVIHGPAALADLGGELERLGTISRRRRHHAVARRARRAWSVS